jgi:alkylated DNA repair protein (DNA oxidative demethylase)
MQRLDVNGAELYKSVLTLPEQVALRDAIRAIAHAAPMFSPVTRWGKPMSVRMTSAGKYGWYSDRRGYRYIDRHPAGGGWPAIPALILKLWSDYSGCGRAPDCCLVNHYTEGAKMGLHQDRDEADFSYPVVSVSLGDDALFRVGGTERRDPTRSVWLSSGDVVVIGGAARLAYHGIDRIKFGSSRLLDGGGRINITLRVVDG